MKPKALLAVIALMFVVGYGSGIGNSLMAYAPKTVTEVAVKSFIEDENKTTYNEITTSTSTMIYSVNLPEVTIHAVKRTHSTVKVIPDISPDDDSAHLATRVSVEQLQAKTVGVSVPAIQLPPIPAIINVPL